MRIEDGGLGVAAHTRGAHLVHAEAGWSVVVVRLHLAAPGALEHLRRLRLDVRANGPLVVAPRAMDAEQRNPPLIRPHRVQVHVVLVARQALTVSLQADLPRSWSRSRCFSSTPSPGSSAPRAQPSRLAPAWIP